MKIRHPMTPRHPVTSLESPTISGCFAEKDRQLIRHAMSLGDPVSDIYVMSPCGKRGNEEIKRGREQTGEGKKKTSKKGPPF